MFSFELDVVDKAFFAMLLYAEIVLHAGYCRHFYFAL